MSNNLYIFKDDLYQFKSLMEDILITPFPDPTSIISLNSLRLEIDISSFDILLEILFNNSVGIGEHTDILTEIDKWVNSLSQAEENLSTLNNNFNTLFNKSVEK